ncbi:tryptophan synthase subunit alpha [Mangrovihabitans endophyticus]|uniref:Tryptophan synthase alpha chain n=1 Tax=Mangrovihabitans endophyticus TaxID=1751298 RepID=A0A8J3FQZ7_9ACTN|nr:tryptophan synthase subunit alpha [Mangrovihabitans endophyticus]GGL11473.1 tryptophan synthase alpha chain [Mangrovihabitans endophyticus]
MSGQLATALRTAPAPRLVPYVTGGITANWTDYLLAYQDSGADAVEVGLPFSDPMLDGATLQQASDRALARGTRLDGVLADLAAVRDRLTVPVVVMTYANPVVRLGVVEFCRRLAEAGASGLIVPDVPVDELGSLESVAAVAGIDLVLLAAPSTSAGRLREICARSRGFVYAVSTMGVTGERTALDDGALTLASRAREASDLPVLLGFGVSTPAQAARACRAADGVVVASALMRKVLEGAGPDRLARIVADFRAAMDRAA